MNELDECPRCKMQIADAAGQTHAPGHILDQVGDLLDRSGGWAVIVMILCRGMQVSHRAIFIYAVWLIRALQQFVIGSKGCNNE